MIKNSQSISIKYTVVRVHVRVHSKILAIKHSILDCFLSLQYGDLSTKVDRKNTYKAGVI